MDFGEFLSPFTKGAAAFELHLEFTSGLYEMERKNLLLLHVLCSYMTLLSPRILSWCGIIHWNTAPGQQKKEIPVTPQMPLCKDTYHFAPHLIVTCVQGSPQPWASQLWVPAGNNSVLVFLGCYVPRANVLYEEVLIQYLVNIQISNVALLVSRYCFILT